MRDSLLRRRFTRLAAAAALAFPLSTAAQDSAAPAGIAETRAALEKWVETQRIISKEQRDLELSKEMLSERIRLVEREIESLRERIAEAEESIAEADTKREELIAQNEDLKGSAGALTAELEDFERGMQELLPRLPAPIRDRVRPLSQRLPEPDAQEIDLTVSERFQNVIGILNEIDKFHRTVAVTSEVRELPDGSGAEVTALYLGIGRGWYVGANNTVAGTGSGADGEWTWTSDNDAAPAVAEAIAIMENEQVASFVPLPLVTETNVRGTQTP